MATKSIVPRASGEGQLGSSLKIWKEIHQLTSSFGTANFKENENNILTLNNSPLIVSSGLSGSLTQLADGSSYLVEGAGVSIASGSTGQVTISATGAGSMSSFTLAGFTVYNMVTAKMISTGNLKGDAKQIADDWLKVGTMLVVSHLLKGGNPMDNRFLQSSVNHS